MPKRPTKQRKIRTDRRGNQLIVAELRLPLTLDERASKVIPKLGLGITSRNAYIVRCVSEQLRRDEARLANLEKNV